MCGIALLLERISPLQHEADSANAAASTAVSSHRFRDAAVQSELQRRLSQRGPDHFAVVTPSMPPDWADLQLAAAVLHLRGDSLVEQPKCDHLGNVLCWNGEVFGGLLDDHTLYDDASHSDTQALSAALAHVAASAAATEGSDSDDDVESRVLAILRRIEGPFAFVWLHAASQRVYFGHDRFGRRSLLSHVTGSSTGEPEDLLARLASSSSSSSSSSATASVSIADVSTLCLSSVALRSVDSRSTAFHEVPCSGLFSLDLRRQTLSFHAYAPLVPSPAMPIDRYDCGLPTITRETPVDDAAQHLLTVLSNAVGVRVRTIPPSPSPCPPPAASSTTQPAPRVAVLFSGGLDSVVLAALAHLHVVAVDEPIDLLNVCFDAASQFRSPDRQAAERSVAELRARFPTRCWRFVRINVPFDAVLADQRALLEALAPCDTHMDFNIGAAFWWLARGTGIRSDGPHDHDQHDRSTDLNAFLWANGVAPEQRALEAAVQALSLFAVDPESPTVCPVPTCRFQRKPGCPLGVCRLCCLGLQRLVRRALKATTDGEALDPTTPQGKDASAALRQLDALLLPSQETAATLLDVCAPLSSCSLELCRVHRDKKRVQQPSTAVPVEGQAQASVAASPHQQADYTTPARVLLVGVGADEQLGGYGRHRTAFLTRGTAGLEAELARDLQRIWKRNLGRDDRVLAAHARETRLPFLDERVVAWLAALPVALRCDLSRDRARGDGDKLVLRRVARALGLSHCAGLAKRAIQFGTRIAKHSNRHAFGSNRQASGDAKLRLEHAEEDGGEDDQEEEAEAEAEDEGA